jgi:hypothetical protein
MGRLPECVTWSDGQRHVHPRAADDVEWPLWRGWGDIRWHGEWLTQTGTGKGGGSENTVDPNDFHLKFRIYNNFRLKFEEMYEKGEVNESCD